MNVAQYIDQLETEGREFLDAARASGPDAPVPTCPGWCVTDLVRHLAFVHRWACRYVAERLTQYQGDVSESVVLSTGPSGDDLWPFYVGALHELVETLRIAPDDVACWSVLPGSPPRTAWSRRQAHESAIHRADAEYANRSPVRPSSPAFAIDGIDELLTGFLGRPLRAEVSRGRVVVAPTDVNARWIVEVGERRSHGVCGDGDGSAVMRGSASDLYYVLWNRLPLEVVDVEGDRALVSAWRSTHAVSW